jgi:MYXO-CTERM domain-containing protein
MLRQVLNLLLVVVLGFSGTALANHAVSPTNLTQRIGTTTLAAGDIVATGQPVLITATAPSTTNGSGTYELEIELRPVGQSFTGVKTHSGGTINDKGGTAEEWVGLSINPGLGNWHWQARMRTNSTSTPTSSWVMFNAGNTAFTVGSGTDLTVEAVTLSGVNSDTAANTLAFNVDAVIRNRGDLAVTNGFTWRAWLSTDKVLNPTTDQLIFTSTNPLTVGASTTVSDSGAVLLDPAPAAGAYYILVEVDPDASEAELVESNNTGSSANSFIKGVELVASSITGAPANIGPGQPVTLNVNFYNQGLDTPSTNPVRFQILASFNDTADSTDKVVHDASVTVQGGMTFNSPVTLNNLPANGLPGGDYHWILVVDSDRKVAEGNETNNEVASPLPMTHAQQADLQADFVDLVDVSTGVSKRTADIGEPVRFDVRVSNVGDFQAGLHKIGFVLSKDNNLSLVPGADLIFGDTEVSGVLPGSANQRSLQFTVTLPTQMNGQPLTAGSYYFFVFVDSYSDIDELNEANNSLIVSGQVQLRLPSSDYRAMNVRAPSAAAGGEAIQVTRTFANIGTDAGAEVEYSCFASKNQIIATGDFPLAFIEADGSTTLSRRLQLDRGEVNVATEWVRLPHSLPAGEYYVGCIIDPTNTLIELDELNNAAISNEPVQVTAQSFQIVTQQLPDGILGVPYRVRIATIGATGPVNFSADGTLSGTPTELGVTSFRVIATSGTATHEVVLAVRILANTGQLSITTDRLPPALNSTTANYQAVLSAAGGAGPYTWSITGQLPSGINLEANSGYLSGAPRPGLPNREHELTVHVRDQLGATTSKNLTLRLMPAGALAISSLALKDGVVGKDYFNDLSAAVVGGGLLSKPLAWSLTNGSLPPGLTLSTHSDSATGLITGVPQVAGNFPITLQVADADGRFDSVDLMLTVFTSQLRVYTETLPGTLHAGDAVDFAILSSSELPTKFRLYSGVLPEGVTLDEAGRISGTLADNETVYGAYNFVVEAVDERGGTGLGVFMLEVRPVTQAEGCGCSTGSAGATGALFALLAMARAFGRRRRRA